MSFCQEAWRRTGPLQQAICDHPFNLALADQSLDPERFGFYLAQDARYLVAFARTLAAAATRAPDPATSAFLAGSARDALAVEGELHRGELRALGTDGPAVATSPTCLAYSSYLAATALTEPFPVVVAALLPCFWVYQHVGQVTADRSGPLGGHRYRAWIETYTDERFAAAVAAAKETVDREAEGAPAPVVERMFAAFARATEYEWLFWDSAWRRETWPTAELRSAVPTVDA